MHIFIKYTAIFGYRTFKFFLSKIEDMYIRFPLKAIVIGQPGSGPEVI